MWYGRYVYMTSKSSASFWYPGSACSMLVSCIWYRDQRKLWSLQASRRKTRLECRLRSASAQINWKTYGWLDAHSQKTLFDVVLRQSVKRIRNFVDRAWVSTDVDKSGKDIIRLILRIYQWKYYEVCHRMKAIYIWK